MMGFRRRPTLPITHPFRKCSVKPCPYNRTEHNDENMGADAASDFLQPDRNMVSREPTTAYLPYVGTPFGLVRDGMHNKHHWFSIASKDQLRPIRTNCNH